MTASDERPDSGRRKFLGISATAVMGGGLVCSYGTLGAMAVRYLYPAGSGPRSRVYVTRLSELAAGDSLPFQTPQGHRINITRQSGGESADDFIALSSVCPHLGCQVHWEAAKNRYFCPCHNGAFDAEGTGTSGPPTGQQLLRYPLSVENGLLFIEIPDVGGRG